MMTPKDSICLWFDRDALEAAQFYAATFPDSSVGTVMHAPGDFPDGKRGDVLTVEFTVADHPTSPDGRHGRSRSRDGEARVRRDDDDAQDRHRRHRASPARLSVEAG